MHLSIIIKSYGNKKLVYLGDDTTSYEIEGYSDVNIRLMNGMEKRIHDVLHVPGLAKKKFCKAIGQSRW